MKYIQPLYLSSLLSQSDKEKKDYFFNKTVQHKFLLDAHQKLLSAILNPLDSTTISLIGPSGVGKDTVCKGVIAALIKILMPQLEKDKGCIPAILYEIPTPVSHIVKWPDIHAGALEVTKEPLLASKTIFVSQGTSNSTSDFEHLKKIYSREGTMRESYLNHLKNRRVVAVFFNEAHRLLMVRSSEDIILQLEHIITLANKSKVPHVLAGTYKLIETRQLNGQSIRRNIDIHFPRYHLNKQITEDRTEFDEFVEALLTLLAHLAIEKVPDPTDPDSAVDCHFFYQYCLGCIGLLKEWLYRALTKTLEKKQNTLTKATLEETALSVKDLQTLLDEANHGEAEMSRKGSLEAYRASLGIKDDVPESKDDKSSQKHSSIHTIKPGDRLPVRDTVGM